MTDSEKPITVNDMLNNSRMQARRDAHDAETDLLAEHILDPNLSGTYEETTPIDFWPDPSLDPYRPRYGGPVHWRNRVGQPRPDDWKPGDVQDYDWAEDVAANRLNEIADLVVELRRWLAQHSYAVNRLRGRHALYDLAPNHDRIELLVPQRFAPVVYGDTHRATFMGLDLVTPNGEDGLEQPHLVYTPPGS